ncbi:MAG: sigma-70 family RNA polymerase sigma factor [Myxococcota bacterium]
MSAADQDGAGPSRPADSPAGPSKGPEPELLLDENEEAHDNGDDEGDVFDVPSSASLPAPRAKSESSLPVSRPAARTSALDRFLSEVGKYPVLTPEEEQVLTSAYFERQDPVALRKLVIHNLRLVVKMAYKYRRAWASVLDLVQEGNVGLVEAVRRYDPSKGAKFSTYATFWIRAYMLRYLLENSRTVRLSRTRVGRKLFFQLAKERAKLQAQGIDPGPKLLAERLGVDEGELSEVVRHMDQSEVRLDAPVGDASTGTILDGMASSSPSPEAETFRRELNDDVGEALEAFKETLTDSREQAAWEEHLLSEDPVSLSELGKRFGVTKQRMGQIVSGLRKRLKVHLVERLGPDIELGYQFDESDS